MFRRHAFLSVKDFHCGSTTEAETTLTNVQELRKILTNKSAHVDPAAFAHTGVDEVKWSYNNVFEALTDGRADSSIAQTVCDSSATGDSLLLDAMYSKDEQQQSTDKGFYGHPSIGALIFKFMTQAEKFAQTQGSLNDINIATPVIRELRKGGSEKVKVFIVGSVFGGTGASVFSNLARYIRREVTAIPGTASDRVLISGCLLLPYFALPDKKDQSDHIQLFTEEFMPKSMVALNFYGDTDRGADAKQTLRQFDSKAHVFDSLYVVGNQAEHHTSEAFATGGSGQKSHFDIVDLFAAQAATDFFNALDASFAVQQNENALHILQAAHSDSAELTRFTWENVDSNLKQHLVALYSFSSYVITVLHQSFYLNRNDERAKAMNRMAAALYGTKMSLKGSRHRATEEEYAEISRKVSTVFQYCKSYIKFLRDIANTGRNWEDSRDGVNAQYELFDLSNINELWELADTMETEDAAVLRQKCENLSNAKLISGLEIDNAALQAHLNEVFNGIRTQHYSAVTKPEARVADYLHTLYTACREQLKSR